MHLVSCLEIVQVQFQEEARLSPGAVLDRGPEGVKDGGEAGLDLKQTQEYFGSSVITLRGPHSSSSLPCLPEQNWKRLKRTRTTTKPSALLGSLVSPAPADTDKQPSSF